MKSFKQYYMEEYFTRGNAKLWNSSFELWKNPTRKEIIKDIGGGNIRGIIFLKSGNIYIADANLALHKDVVDTVEKDANEYSPDIGFIGKINGSKFTLYYETGTISKQKYIDKNYQTRFDILLDDIKKSKAKRNLDKISKNWEIV